jgi:PAS domain S-box-containing protein
VTTQMGIRFLGTGAKSFVAIVFIMLAAAIASVGYLAFHYQREAIGLEAEQRLTAIAELRARQVTAWISERRANAKVQGQRSFLANEIARWLERGAVKGDTAAAIQSQLVLIAESYGYRIVTLVDAQGRPLLSTHDPPEINAVEYKAVAETILTGNTVISDFHFSVNKNEREMEIDILAPVFARGNKTSPVAALIFDIDPETSLHPLIESWPVPSRSSETLLVEKNENRVRYLTDLRYRKDAQMDLQLSLDQPDLVAAMGLRGQQGIVTGVDYRGVNVLAFLRRISGTPWVLVTKVDRAEIYEPIQEIAGITAFVTTILILAAALTIIAWVRTQRETEEKFHGFAEVAEQVFWITDLFPERILYVNPAFERVWGDTIKNLYDNPRLWTDSIHPEDRPHVTEAFKNWVQGVPGTRYDVTYRVVRPDGEIRWIADCGFILQSKGAVISRVAGIAEDITVRKQAEEVLRRTNAELEERVQSRTVELERSQQELRSLSAVRESIQDEERKRIARELHDELAQKLTVLKLQLQALESALPANEPGLISQVRDMNLLLTATMYSVGQIAADLRSAVLDHLGLVAALRDLVEKFSQQTKIDCEFSVHPPDLSVDNRLASTLYRMVQESLTNVSRHAQATEVIVSLYGDPSGKISLDINDNGKGFSQDEQWTRTSFGLVGMRERAAMLGGEMKIQSEPGAGTSIEIVIPSPRSSLGPAPQETHKI